MGISESGSASESKGKKGKCVMGFGHEKLDIYNAALEYVGWAYRFSEGCNGHRHAKEQLLRASQIIPLKIAEGNGKATEGDRRHCFFFQEVTER